LRYAQNRSGDGKSPVSATHGKASIEAGEAMMEKKELIVSVPLKVQIDVFINHFGNTAIRFSVAGLGVLGLVTYEMFMEVLHVADPKLWEMQSRAHEIKERKHDLEIAVWREAGTIIGATDCARMNEQITKHCELLRGKYASQMRLLEEEMEALKEEARQYLTATYL
jgi:hypothetical protein